MKGLVFEVDKIVNLNKVFNAAVLLTVANIITVFVVQFFQYHRRKLSGRNRTVRLAYMGYVSPVPMYSSFMVLAGVLDILLLWSIGPYEVPFLSIAIAVSIGLNKAVKLYRMYDMVGTETKTLKEVLTLLIKNRSDVLTALSELEGLAKKEDKEEVE